MIDLWKNRNWGPMLLKEEEKVFDSLEFLYELKFDGQRAIIFVNPKNVKIVNRHSKDISYLFPELQKLKTMVKNNVIFDGEIVAFENNMPSFTKLQERTHLKDKMKIRYYSESRPIIFVCFDILYWDKNLVDLPLWERKKILNKFSDNEYFIKNKFVLGKGKELFEKVKKLKLEGIVAKNKNSLYYTNTRTDNWIKIKNLKRESFFIGGYVDNKSNVGSLCLGEYQNGVFNFVGKVSVAKKYKVWQQVKVAKKLIKSPFSNFDEKVNFVMPKYKCIVKYLERTKKGHLRQPIFKEMN